MASRFDSFQFKSGNIHFDIHEHNVCFTQNGRMKLLDFDSAQNGAYFWELVRTTAMYMNFRENQPDSAITIRADLIDELLEFSCELAANVTPKDVRLMLARVKLGSLQDPNYPFKEFSSSIFERLNDFAEA